MKFYIAPTKTGRMLKIVTDVTVPSQCKKLKDMGIGTGKPLQFPALIARFTNEELAEKFLSAYNQIYGDKED